jgi:Protein of unknown function (DUF3667)
MPCATALTEDMQQRCSNCGTALTGEYCAACGQRRLAGRLTLASLATEVVRRVFRFDRAFAVTVWRMLREPGRLVPDYLAGRRAGYLEPIQYLISSVFVQFLVATLTERLAPAVGRASAYGWLGRLSGVLAIKVLMIFWMATLWRLMFRSTRYNLAEIYVFAMYAFGTLGLLWTVPPLVDLTLPYQLGADPVIVLLVTFAIEVSYLTYAVWQFGNIPVWICGFRVAVVLVVGDALLTWVAGPDYLAHLLLPTLHLRH